MKKVQECPAGLWDETARLDQSATFFQTRAWYSLVAPYAPGAPYPLLFEVDGVQAVLPSIRRRKFPWDSYHSPFGTYTALLCPRKLPAAALREIGAWLEKRNVELFSSPVTDNPIAIGASVANATYLIDLESCRSGDFTASWAENQRRHLGKGRKGGIAVRPAASPADVDAYLGIYAKTRARWGERARGQYPDAMFHSLWNALRGTDALRFWLAEAQGGIVGGYICFYHNRHAVQWQNSVHPDFLNAGVNQVLLQHIIADAAARGFARFDMNPSGGLEGVENFKKSFGTRRVEFRNYASTAPGYALARRIKAVLGKKG